MGLDREVLERYIEEDLLEPFYQKRTEKLSQLKLNTVLLRKNPYLYKAKYITTPEEYVRAMIDAYLSLQEETIFGNLLEGLAIKISQLLYGGWKVGNVQRVQDISQKRPSIDLEFDRSGKHYLVSIKSGPHWGNADQVKTMQRNFQTVKNVLSSKYSEIECINGCIYGKDNKHVVSQDPSFASYSKLCGQAFWAFIANDPNLYQDLIVPLDKAARIRSDNFHQLYIGKLGMLTMEFDHLFSQTQDGLRYINWQKVLEYVSKASNDYSVEVDTV